MIKNTLNIPLENSLACSSPFILAENIKKPFSERIDHLKEEVYARLAQAYGFETDNLTAIKPLLPKKVIKELNVIFIKITLNICFFDVFSTKLKQTSYETSAEETERKGTYLLEHLIDTVIKQTLPWFKQQLITANVFSLKELLSKSDALALYKKVAEQEYFSTLENLERREKIDLNLLESFNLNPEEKKIVACYWKEIKGKPKEGKAHLIVENKSKEIFLTCQKRFSEILKKIKQEEHRQSNQPFPFIVDFPEKIYLRVLTAGEEIAAQLTQEPIKNEEKNKRLMRDYSFIKGKMIIYAVFNRKLRKCIEEKFVAIKEEAKVFDKIFRDIYKGHIESYGKLAKEQEVLANQRMSESVEFRKNGKQKESVFRQQLAEHYEKTAQEYREIVENRSYKLSQQNLWNFVSNHIQVDPQMFSSILFKCKEKPCEKKLFDFYKIVVGPDFIEPQAREDFNVERDIHIDLDPIVEPIAFFVDLIKKRDEECLELFKTEKAEVENFRK